MSRVKACLFALMFAGAAHGAWAADETWPLKAATGRLTFHPELARDLGIQVHANAPAGSPGGLVAEFEAAGRLELRAPGSLFRDVGTGELRLTSAAVLRLGGTEIPVQGLTVQRGQEERTLAIVGDGRVLFLADYMHFTVDRAAGRIRMYNLDLRLTAEAARALGDERLANIAVAVMELEGPIAIPAGSVEQPDGACTTPNWGLPDNDTQMITIGSIQQMARDGNLVGIAPSATVGNVGTTDVPWYSKFSGNFPPYNNDQHPFLIWDMYRLAGGVLEQIGVSPLKHAFVTVNSNCACPGGNILWVNCQDTYGTGTNDGIGSLTLRPEITAFTGVWKRCGSIFDPNCDNIQNQPPPRANPMDRRMAVSDLDLQTPGAVYYIHGWYIIRDDTNIFNGVSWRTVTPVLVGSTWTFPPNGLGPMNWGPVMDQWVDPANPGPNAQSVPISTVLGRLKLAMRAFDLGGGLWRYEYGLQNFDFDPRVRSFTVPLPAGVVATNPGFHDPDQNAANNWTATIAAGSITWQAPDEAATQDYGTFYNFRFTANALPSGLDGSNVTMRIQEAKVWKLNPAIVGPATPTKAEVAAR